MLTTVLRRALPAAIVAAGLAGAATAAAAPISSTPIDATTTVRPAGATPQGIIMRDGGVCDPIRHMGC
jgi:hypothetical protein